MAGKCETITNSASAEAGVEALAELGNNQTQQKSDLVVFMFQNVSVLYTSVLT